MLSLYRLIERASLILGPVFLFFAITGIGAFISSLAVAVEIFIEILKSPIPEVIKAALQAIADILNRVFETWRGLIYPVFDQLSRYFGIEIPILYREAISALGLVLARYLNSAVLNGARVAKLTALAPNQRMIDERYGDDVVKAKQEQKALLRKEGLRHPLLEPYALWSAATMLVLVATTLFANLMYLAGFTAISVVLFFAAFALSVPPFLRVRRYAG